VLETASSDENIRTALVLEHGKVVASYVRDDVDPNEPFQCWSTTKSWISLLTGFLVQDGLLTTEETLGEIFPDESYWANVTDADFRKAVTIFEMLTMSSGLISPPYSTDPDVAQEEMMAAMDGGIAGGASAEGSLAFPLIGEKGEFSYLGISNIMSYVILEKTGKTPRQYLAENVLPNLGIPDSDINWWKNSDGVEYAYHGIELTPHQMAKFGQLYVQDGKSSPDNQLISSDWVADSHTPHMAFTSELAPGWEVTATYGSLFWSGEEGTNDTAWCALGAGGQDICIDAVLGRVSVQQRDWEGDMTQGNMIIGDVAMNSSLSFEAVSEDGDTGTTETGSTEDEDVSGSIMMSNLTSNAYLMLSAVAVSWSLLGFL